MTGSEDPKKIFRGTDSNSTLVDTPSSKPQRRPTIISIYEGKLLKKCDNKITGNLMNEKNLNMLKIKLKPLNKK